MSSLTKILSDFNRRSYSSIFPQLLSRESKLFVIFILRGEKGGWEILIITISKSFSRLDDGLHIFNGWLPSSRRLAAFQPTQFILSTWYTCIYWLLLENNKLTRQLTLLSTRRSRDANKEFFFFFLLSLNSVREESFFFIFPLFFPPPPLNNKKYDINIFFASKLVQLFFWKLIQNFFLFEPWSQVEI